MIDPSTSIIGAIGNLGIYNLTVIAMNGTLIRVDYGHSYHSELYARYYDSILNITCYEPCIFEVPKQNFI
jgi:pyruvate carboxylase